MFFHRGNRNAKQSGNAQQAAHCTLRKKRDNKMSRLYWRNVWILLFFFLPALLAGQEEAKKDVVDLALEGTKLTREKLAPDPYKVLASRSSSEQSPMLRSLLGDPLNAGYRSGMFAEQFVNRSDSPQRLYSQTVGLQGADIARGYYGNPFRELDAQLLRAEDPLAHALDALAAVSAPFPYKDDIPTSAQFPNPLRYEFARVIMAISSAERFRMRALRKIPVNPADLLPPLQQIFGSYYPDFDGPDYRLYIKDLESEAMQAGMLDLTLALEDFEAALNDITTTPGIGWYVDTPMGKIVFSGEDDDSFYAEEDALLIFDWAGNDNYALGNQEKPFRSGISIVYDREGDDRYITLPGSGASGILGYGITWDCAGDDRYQGSDIAQASAILGGALLLDRAGNDEYRAVRAAQAYAIGGCALLLDYDGDDLYESVTYSQASAAPYGAAVLADLGNGNDVYRLKNEPLLSPSAQIRTHNSSMGQGMGTGVRSDLSDGRSLPGGVGMLFDQGGDDVYEAQVFCQGTGFLEGAGILVDGGGSDKYSGIWYAQASAAHRAAGVLLDKGTGNDSYTATEFTSIATAHDLSVAFLQDEGGNDSYTVRNLGIGGANDNGVAVFVEEGGDDSYTIRDAEGYGVGGAKISHWGTSRENSLGLALFFELGGDDTYNLKRKGPANDSITRWPQKFPDMDLNSEIGVLVDGNYESPFHSGPRTPADDYDRKMLETTRKERRAYRDQIGKAPQ
jgi:hypothetical protein